MKTSERALLVAEYAVAIMVTGFCVLLHFIFLSHAGGLWRDEAAAINIAEMPSIRDMWHNLYFELFPMTWFLLARTWWWLGFGSDFGFRIMGFLTGMLLIGAMWFTARCFKLRTPLLLLLLIGLNPLVIVYGDSMRAWGLGLFWITIAFGLVWSLVEQPNRWKICCATLVAVAAVQTTYYNSLLLFAICSAGFVTSIRRGNWKRGVLILAIGAIAALTMLPYLKFFRWGEDHYSIIRQNYDLHKFDQKLWDALSGWDAFSREIANVWLWWALLFFAVIAALAFQFIGKRETVSDERKDLLLYSMVALLLAGPVFFLFFHQLRFATAPWYYLPLIMIGGLALEGIYSVTEGWLIVRSLKLAAVVLLFCYAAKMVYPSVGWRMTNVDLVAKHLNDSTGKNDFILLNPFNYGISFARYYRGAAPWAELPAVDDRVHRYDILKQWVLRPDRNEAIQPALNEIRRALNSGGHVWIISGAQFGVGKFSFAPKPPPYFENPGLKQTAKVLNYWGEATDYFLQQHALHNELVPTPAHSGINQFEQVQLRVFSGWKEK